MNDEVTVTARYDSLKDRVVIITGGGQGLGRGYAHHFARQGAIPVIAEINGDKAAAVKREVEVCWRTGSGLSDRRRLLQLGDGHGRGDVEGGRTN